MAFDLKTAKPLTEEELQNYNKKENQEKVYGTRQALLQGASFGQAPHIWGIGQALGGAIGNIANRKNPLKDLYSDYKEGREEFKKEYKTFEDKNKSLAFGGDLVGGLATGGIGAKAVTKLPRAMTLLNSTKLLQSPITRAALVGGAFGGGYGASNTLGKGFDFGSSLLGAGTGAVLGGGLGKLSSIVGNKAKQLLGGKEKALLEGGEKVPQLEGKEIPQLTNAEKILLKEGDIPKNVIDVTKSNAEGVNLPQAIRQETKPLNKTEKFLNSLKTGYQQDATDFIVPNGMENKNFRAFLENPKIQYEASKGSLGRRWETLQNEAANEFRKMNKEISSFVDNAYKDIPDDIVIGFKPNEKTPLDLAQEEINKLAQKKITINQASALKKAQDLLDIIKATATEQDGNFGLSFGNIKDATQQFYALSEKFDKQSNKHAKKMFKNIYDIFAEYRDTNPLAKAASERYKDFKSINKTLGEIGMDVEKVTDNNNAETRIMTNSRGRAGEKMNRALDKVLRVLEKYPELTQFKDLKNKVQLAQVSYDARPSENSKILNAINLTRPLQALGNLTKKEAQDELQVLGMRLLTGKVRPEQFKNVDMFRGGDSVNRAFYRNKAYGNILDTLKSKNLNKDVIEAAYRKYQGAI